jgi:hypothetical protein
MRGHISSGSGTFLLTGLLLLNGIAPAETTLAPRHPAVPQGSAANPIDLFIAPYFQRHAVTPPATVPDATFARRVYLDLWGLLPSPEQYQDFATDRRPDKRRRLVHELLADRRNYTEHWISFWNDLLRNDEGVIYYGLRESISEWLYPAIESNMPYDRMVKALLNPTAAEDPRGFLIGVNWRGTVSASQIPAMQAAQNTAQIFLGVNLKCNSCHDSFISKWKLADAYGLASFFSPEPLDVYRCDKLTGARAALKFIYPQLGNGAPDTPLTERQTRAAELFTAPENGRFARTFVNRIWDRLFGRGLVPSPDDMDGEPFDADLLDWLASDFADHHYDIRYLFERIMTSDAYAFPSVPKPERASGGYVFRGPYPRRLTAEQFADAVSSITGEWQILRNSKPEPGVLARAWRFKSSPLTRALGRPIRDQVYTERNSEATMLQALEVMNGSTLATMLHRGAQRMLGQLPKAPENLFDSGVSGGSQGVETSFLDIDIAQSKRLYLLLEDVDTYDPSRLVAGWANAELAGPGGAITPLAEVAASAKLVKTPLLFRHQKQPMDGFTMPADSRAVFEIAGKGFTRLRATAGLDMRSYRSDVGGKVRFFVFDEEPDMQQLVRVTGDPPVPFAAWHDTADQFTTCLFQYALSRDPLPKERETAARLLTGSNGRISSDGLEDLLWNIFLLPEFQFLR